MLQNPMANVKTMEAAKIMEDVDTTATIILTASIVLTFAMGFCSIFHLHILHHRLRFLQLCGQLLLGVLHRTDDMIHRRLQYCQSLLLYLVLLQGFMYPCNNIAHHVVIMHTCVFNGEIKRLYQLSVRHPKKLFELHPRLLY